MHAFNYQISHILWNYTAAMGMWSNWMAQINMQGLNLETKVAQGHRSIKNWGEKKKAQMNAWSVCAMTQPANGSKQIIWEYDKWSFEVKNNNKKTWYTKADSSYRMRVTVKVSHSSSPSIFDTENSPSRKANPKVSQIRRCFASWPKTSQLSPPPGHCCKSFPSSEGVLPMNEARDAPMLFGQTRL